MTLRPLLIDDTTGRQAAEAGPGASSLIAEWNGANLSQFVSAGSPDFNSGGGTPTLSVASVSERGNVLRWAAGGAANGTTIFMFATASGLVMPTDGERRDVDIEVELYTATFNVSSVGPFFMGDADTPLHGFIHAPVGDAEREAVLNNGTIQVAGANGTGANRWSISRVRGRKPSGAAPQVTSISNAYNAGGAGRRTMRRSGTTSTARGGVAAFGDGSALGATWNSISADRIGLAFRYGATPGNPVDILGVRIYRV